MEKIKRAISLEDDFFDKRIDDILYGYLLSLTTYHLEEKVLYLTEKELSKNKKLIYAIEDFSAIKKKNDAFTLRIKKMQEKGLVQIKLMSLNNKQEKVYMFPNPASLDQRFYLIDKQLLQYICRTFTKTNLQIFIYLADRMQYTQISRPKELWSFTLTEIAEKIKYYACADSREIIMQALYTLQKVGLIDFKEYYETNEKGTPSPRMRLTKVAKSLDEIFTQDQLKNIFKN